jgi:phosphoglycolate phosphatase
LKRQFLGLPLIFDLDGTLVDSGTQILTALNLACAEANLDLISKDFFDQKIGLPINSIISHLKLPLSRENELILSFRAKLKSQIEESNQLFPGVEDFLRYAKDFGHPTAVATSKPTYLAKLVVSNSRLINYIDFVQGTDNFPAKPEPDVILRCLNYFKTDVAAMFGDRVEDVLAARAAKIIPVGIAQGFHSSLDLLSAGAKFAFEDFIGLSHETINSDFLHTLAMNYGSTVSGD